MKEAFIDVETTGLDPYFNGIWELAVVLRIDGTVVDSKIYHMKPFERDRIDPKALAVGHITEEDFVPFPVPILVHADLTSWLKKYVNPYGRGDKFWFIGYNALFDYQFLRKWFEKCGDRFCGSWFWHPPIDVMTLAGYCLREQRPGMADFKLATVAAQLGIAVDREKLHDAGYDIALTTQIFDRLRMHMASPDDMDEFTNDEEKGTDGPNA
jgi:DNA polymerase-3 subunit epsilon